MLYKYCKIDGFDILLKARLRLSLRKDFNDPFELLFSFDEKSTLEELRWLHENDPDLINGFKKLLKDLKIDYDENSSIDVLLKGILHDKKIFYKIWDEYCGKMGITCFSRKSDIIQMWAHYAENHKGIVIGIDESEFIRDNEALIEVNYKDDMISLPLPIGRLRERFKKDFIDVLKRKETKWGYETEVRILWKLDDVDSDGNYYYTIPITSIKEIYLGLRSDEKVEIIAKSIKQREEYNHLKIYKMILSKTDYKLVPKEIF
ncbi:MAG: DUF2971 domain-containing protein [bacterium]|nr:DUF2971 domain-containing protein [bacterium]